MADKPPLYFQKTLGSLRPINAAAEEAMRAIDGRVRVEIKSTRGNVRRNGLYWACLSVAVPMLAEKAPGLTVDLLHKVLKDRRGLYTLVRLPSGDAVKNYDSTSFAKMPENERAEFVTWALHTLASWLGCTVDELRHEGEAQ